MLTHGAPGLMVLIASSAAPREDPGLFGGFSSGRRSHHLGAALGRDRIEQVGSQEPVEPLGMRQDMEHPLPDATTEHGPGPS